MSAMVQDGRVSVETEVDIGTRLGGRCEVATIKPVTWLCALLNNEQVYCESL